MKNLKITFHLSSPVILDRFTTIDSILLSIWFKKIREQKKLKDRFVEVKDMLDEIDFLDKKNDILSGSVWYVEKDALVSIENHVIVKKIDDKKYIQVGNKKSIDTSRGEFKAYQIGMEALVTPSIYFYVRGKKDVIAELLKEVRYIGKKGAIGFGRVNSFGIEEAMEDKSFALDENTPSKPLPCDKFTINSKKVAFFRAYPPYYSKKEQKPCYMPTTALVEKRDGTGDSDIYKAICDTKYISPTSFAWRQTLGKEGVIGVLGTDLPNNSKKGVHPILTDDEKLFKHCILCGEKTGYGIVGNPKNYLPITFNDYGFIESGDFMCYNCWWSLKNEKILGNTLIKNNEEVIYLQGKHMSVKGTKEQQKFRDEFFRNLDLLEPPFLISLKSTANAQHTVFKGKVAISNAMIPISYGTDESIMVDVELLKEAIADMEKIVKENKCIKKAHLTNQEQIREPMAKLSKVCDTEENRKILSEFYKKYDRSVRKVLNRIIV